MPVTSCLFGPSFSLVGESYFSGMDVDFNIAFESEQDEQAVLAYEWYLDKALVIGQNLQNFTRKINCGTHTIGARILSAEGWSGIKSLEFATCKVPTSLFIYGPDSVDEGASTRYYVLQLYSDGTSVDITSQYTFTSTTGGFFDGNVFVANMGGPAHVTISSFKEGIAGPTKQVSIHSISPVVISSVIGGERNLLEGQHYPYTLTLIYSNGSTLDVTDGTDFSFNHPDRGTFNGNILDVFNNLTAGDTVPGEITATYGVTENHLAVVITDNTIPFSFTSSWQFSDSGALVNNPGGGTRNYDVDHIPTGALWSINPSGLGLRISYENSSNCGGSNANIQTGLAVSTISITQPARIKVTWSGMAEAQSTDFEIAEIRVDGVLIGKATSPGGGLGCATAPVITIYELPNGLSITAGIHELQIKCSTVDPLYHTNAYYQFSITLLPDNDEE